MSTVWEGERLRVERRDELEVVETPAAVAIVAVDAEGRVVLVRQERPAVRASLLELPAGVVDDGESPDEAARRELAEETGLRGGRWRELRLVHPSPGFLHEPLTLFLAEALEEGEQDTDDGEDVRVVRLTRAETEEALGELANPKTSTGLLLSLPG
jgi:8-oxo-dGTP pyrophosphatase MutT (NUDIX family)